MLTKCALGLDGPRYPSRVLLLLSLEPHLLLVLLHQPELVLELLQSLLLVGQQTGLGLQILQRLQLGLGQVVGRPLGRLLARTPRLRRRLACKRQRVMVRALQCMISQACVAALRWWQCQPPRL